MHTYVNNRVRRTVSLAWRRDDTGWLLLAGRRRMGRVVPDVRYPGLYRSLLSGGRLSDMSNLARAKDSVLAAAERELEWEGRQQIANDPLKCPVNGGVFPTAASPIAARTADGIYDAQADFSSSIDETYRIIRERVAAGAPGCTPREVA